MEPVRTVLVVDVANVMGSRPDGWWRDRAGAATRLLASLAALPGTVVHAPDGDRWRLLRIVAVLEGRARTATAPEGAAGLDVVLAPADGDTAIAALATEHGGEAPAVAVVTADRGLRERLPADAVRVGPRWLLDLLP